MHVPRGTAGAASFSGVAGSSATASLPAASGVVPVPKQFWLTIEKSFCEPTSSALAWICRLVIVSGASPVFWMTTGTAFSAAGGCRRPDGNVGGRPRTVPTTAVPMPLRFVKLVSASVTVPPSCSWW